MKVWKNKLTRRSGALYIIVYLVLYQTFFLVLDWVCGALADPSMAIMLGTAAALALVAGIAAGLTIYFLSQDHEQAKAIESVISAIFKLFSVNGATLVVVENGNNLPH
ncbi:hypothetical protein [Wolbachia pipientis]|uniref:hypothetical protein n=1 Tax=Wolbachia pipientis TaxID=955 RepID=UPI0025A49BDA|nr:hypothetical protein [Wolbachia pipientis]MDM8335039.1 hypothetical protein [Wolbachia pipientis]